jgi:VanZ family protein
MAVIFALSAQSRPLPFLPSAVLSEDKLLHLAEYSALGLLLFHALGTGGRPPVRAAALALLLASLYGASDEIHQYFVPDRSCDVFDWMADTAGGALGAGFAAFLRLRRARASIRA